MDYLSFAQQNGNPSVYSNKYTLQNSPVLTKFNTCDKSLSPQAQMAYLQDQQGQRILINNNPQKNQLLGVSDSFTGSMQQYQPLTVVPVQQLRIRGENDQFYEENRWQRDNQMQAFFFVILIIFIVVNGFILLRLQKVQGMLKMHQSAQYVLK